MSFYINHSGVRDLGTSHIDMKRQLSRHGGAGGTQSIFKVERVPSTRLVQQEML